MVNRDHPIGVFDSGLGGLTVLRAIRDAMPEEDTVYLGDTARVPYGARSAETVLRYARGCAQRLLRERIKLLVVACNTVSAVALDALRVELDMPVIGVISPGARAGLAASRTHRIGVVATAGTVASGAYVRAAFAESSRSEVFQQAAPLLVPLVEEGWTEGQVPELVIRRYLEPLENRGIDTLVLGCTHYPLLRPAIEHVLASITDRPMQVVDSAQATATELKTFLQQRELEKLPASERPPSHRLLVTDVPSTFREVASRFLSCDLERVDVEHIDL